MCRLPSAAQSAVDGKRRGFFFVTVSKSGLPEKKDPAWIIDSEIDLLIGIRCVSKSISEEVEHQNGDEHEQPRQQQPDIDHHSLDILRILQ